MWAGKIARKQKWEGGYELPFGGDQRQIYSHKFVGAVPGGVFQLSEPAEDSNRRIYHQPPPRADFGGAVPPKTGSPVLFHLLVERGPGAGDRGEFQEGFPLYHHRAGRAGGLF